MKFIPLPLKEAKPLNGSPKWVYFFIGKVVKREKLLIKKDIFKRSGGG